MERKRDEKGRFVKMYLTREEYEAKIDELKTMYSRLFRQAQEEHKWCAEWKESYESEVKKVHRLEHLVDIFSQSMLWLYDRVPFWTKKKFRSYYDELIESNNKLNDVSEKTKKFIQWISN